MISRSAQRELIEVAQALDKKWREESKAVQYDRLVNANHPTTKPDRGIGVTGISIVFVREIYRNSANYRPVFRVQTPGRGVGARTFGIRAIGLQKAWENAVNVWADFHQIKDIDRARTIAHPPNKTTFIKLRRRMNQEGHNIPIAALKFE